MKKLDKKIKIKDRSELIIKKIEKKPLELGAVSRHDISKAPRVGEWRNMHPEVIENKCIGCQSCVMHCPEATIEMSSVSNQPSTGKQKAQIDLEWCKGCGVCAAVCPVKAIIMKKDR